MTGADRDVVKVLEKRIEKRYDAILLRTRIAGIEAQSGGLKVTFEGTSAPKPETYDAILMAVGRRPNGREIREIRGGEIGLVFQEPMTSFSPVHTVGAQIVEAVMLHGDVDKKEARLRGIEALRKVGIPKPERRIDEYSFELSGGLRQRAMIAVALSCDPRLLIADEPTTALDVTTQAQILDLLRHIQRERKMAIMLITHNLGVVAEMCDEVVVMYLGRVVERGPVDAIFHAPQHPYTQTLLRSIPSIQARVRTKLPTIAGSIPHPHNRPPGCPFHVRCPHASERCRREKPALRPVGAGMTACHFAETIGDV